MEININDILGENIQDALVEWSTLHQIRILFLPVYCPELDPCELVFSVVKKRIRENRGILPFWMTIVQHFTFFARETMAEYQHCINYYKNNVFKLPPGLNIEINNNYF